MPEFPSPSPELTREHVLNMILSSIAMEELALSHILNAEGEKIQYVLSEKLTNASGTPDCESVLAVNKSVTSMLEMVMQNQLILKNKMEKVLEYLPRPVPPCPSPVSPCPAPVPPCPVPPCRPIATPPQPVSCRHCPPQQASVCFSAVPGLYRCGEALYWNLNRNWPCCNFDGIFTEGSSIHLARFGYFKVDFMLDLDISPNKCSKEMFQLCLVCGGEYRPVSTHIKSNPNNFAVLSGSAFIDIPTSHSLCRVALSACLPAGCRVKQGSIAFTSAAKC